LSILKISVDFFNESESDLVSIFKLDFDKSIDDFSNFYPVFSKVIDDFFSANLGDSMFY